MKKSIVILGKSTCTHCTEAKKLLRKKGVPYHFLESTVSSEKFFQLLFKRYPYSPKVIVNGKFIGGYDELVKYLK